MNSTANEKPEPLTVETLEKRNAEVAAQKRGPNRHQKRTILGAMRRAKRQAKRQRARALNRGFGKLYDRIVNPPQVAEATPPAPEARNLIAEGAAGA